MENALLLTPSRAGQTIPDAEISAQPTTAVTVGEGVASPPSFAAMT